jgi:hypothetical protein
MHETAICRVGVSIDDQDVVSHAAAFSVMPASARDSRPIA